MAYRSIRSRQDMPLPPPLPAINEQNLPIILPRPAKPADDVARPIINLMAPLLSHLPGHVIRSELARESAQLLAGLAAMRVPLSISSNRVPPSLEIPFTQDPTVQATPIYPSHILAMSEPPTPLTPPDYPCSLIPIHGPLLAAYACKLRIQAPAQQGGEFPGCTNVAVRRVIVASLPAFVALRAFMYSRRIDAFLAALLPFPPRAISGIRAAELAPIVQDERVLEQLERHFVLMTPGGAREAWWHAKHVRGVYETMCQLGIYDDLLWQALDLAWHILRRGLVFHTGKEQMAVSPRPQNSH
ncbi:hypothetical protein C8R43DRAFT_485808 [Mycena crocata]|nr:hypothetical protein C8R43DRAFT_485808 [Mycena crocata]